MKYSACIEFLFNEFPFLKRIKKAKEYNFDAIEFWDWKDKDIESIKSECSKNKISIALFVGSVEGQMVNPNDNERFIEGVRKSIDMAIFLNCNQLSIDTNTVKYDGTIEPLPFLISEKDKKDNIIYVMKEISKMAEKFNITLLIEPLNTIIDHKGYYIENTEIGYDLIRKVDSKYIRLLYDIYHMQIMEDNIINNLKNNIELIGHIHVADVPGRNEPGTGEINYHNIYKKLLELKYDKFLGFEYIPSGSTAISLNNAKRIFNF